MQAVVGIILQQDAAMLASECRWWIDEEVIGKKDEETQEEG